MSEHEEVKGKIEGKGGVPKFQKGKFSVKISTSQKKRVGVVHHFTHDESVVKQFANVLSSKAHTFEQEVSNDPMDREDFIDLGHRMVFAAVSKKMATALGPSHELAYSGALSRIGRASVTVPVGIVPVIDGFGRIQTDELTWEMVAQPAWALTYYGRAYSPAMVEMHGVQQNVNRRDGFFVNARWAAPFRMFLELLLGVVNSWTQTAPAFAFAFGGANVTLRVPTLVSGFVTYADLVAPVPNKPADVLWALACGVIVEEVMGVANHVPTPAQLQLLNVQRVYLVNWNTEDYDRLGAAYYDLVESQIEHAFGHKMTMSRLQGLKAFGSPWQLIRREASFMGYTPVTIPNDALDVGWMMSGGGVGHFLQMDTYSISGEGTGLEKVVDHVASMVGGRRG